MEQEHTTPSSPEQAQPETDVEQGRDVVVDVSPEVLAQFDALGADNEETQQWLAQNGIGAHDRIIVGEDVYTANPHDFLTRDTIASEELAAARSIVNLEEAIEHDIDVHTAELVAEVSSERESQLDREEIVEDMGETAVEEVIEHPATEGQTKLEALMSGEASTSLAFDAYETASKYAEREARQLISNADLDDARATASAMLDGVRIAYSHPGQEGQQYIRTMDSAAVQQVDSILRRAQEGTTGAEAVAFEVGALLTSVRDYHAAEVILQKVNAAREIFPDEDRERILDVGHMVRQAGQQQGQEGAHFARMAYDLDMQANQRLEATGRKPDLAYIAYLGAGIGLSSRLGAGQMGNAYGRLDGAVEHLRRFQK